MPAALALGAAGAAVTLASRTEAEIEAVAAEIRRRGGIASTLPLDVDDCAPAAALIGAAGFFDILVNNAGTNQTRAMAADFGPRGIRVNSLCPTFIETPLTAAFLADAAFRSVALGKIKLGRLEDVMGGIVFLASDASAPMTGAALMLDGGWTSTS